MFADDKFAGIDQDWSTYRPSFPDPTGPKAPECTAYLATRNQLRLVSDFEDDRALVNVEVLFYDTSAARSTIEAEANRCLIAQSKLEKDEIEISSRRVVKGVEVVTWAYVGSGYAESMEFHVRNLVVLYYDVTDPEVFVDKLLDELVGTTT